MAKVQRREANIARHAVTSDEDDDQIPLPPL